MHIRAARKRDMIEKKRERRTKFEELKQFHSLFCKTNFFFLRSLSFTYYRIFGKNQMHDCVNNFNPFSFFCFLSADKTKKTRRLHHHARRFIMQSPESL
jgi:hypothetical protein